MNIAGWLRLETHGVLDLLFPPSCPSCEAPLECGPARFCLSCRTGIPCLRSPRCPSCWLPYPGAEGTDHPCESCLRDPPAFSEVRAAGIYAGLLQKAIQQFKFENATHFDAPLASLLTEILDLQPFPVPPDLVAAVPLHSVRIRERGYNQSHLLARRISDHLRVPLDSQLLTRIKPTLPQQTLPAKVRQKNLRRAFTMSQRLEGEKVLLVDDVLTTGTTARECSRTLLKGGAGGVFVAVLGRASRHFF